MEKRQTAKAQTEEKKMKRAKTLLLQEKKREKVAERERIAQMLLRGETGLEKPVRSDANGKENKVLKPWLRTYQDVDENITAVPNKMCPY